MSETLLQTKLYIPPLRPNLVPRQHLIERLNQGLHHGHKLTLISAPAGFGKSTLASEWVTGCGQPAAWLSLDEGDNDPTRFLTYFVAALRTLVLSEVEGVTEDIGDGVLAMLQSSQPPPTESILTALINEITAVPDKLILVLDDYHLVDSPSIDEALTFLVENLPPNMHLVFATREDPRLPLPRLRAQGQISELRVADLRFTPDEAAAFLNQVMNLDLSAAEVIVLESRTEGWIAGLQLAALSMQGRENVHGFIKAFAGDNRYVVDYLVEEVLHRQPEHVRNFLLQTSILDRLEGSLCDAVRFGETPDSAEMLQALDRGNLFVIPLDDVRRWYRYHHLFADVLQAHLIEEQADLLPDLHRRASMWYEQNNLPAAAIRHALAAEDFEHAAGLIELIRPEMDSNFQSGIWLNWVQALPEDLIYTRPVLCAGYGWALLDCGLMDGSEARFQDAERWLEAPAGMIVVDEEQFRSLPSSIATARAYRALALGDVPGTVTHARRALDLLPEGEQRWHGAASSLLGLALYTSGDLEAAHTSLANLMADMLQASRNLDAISLTFLLAEIRMTLGRLREAASIYEQALQLAASQGEPLLLGASDLYRGLGELHIEQNNLETAVQNLQRGEELGLQAALTDWSYRLCVSQARLKQVQGDLDGALHLLHEAERLHVTNPLPDVHPVAAQKTRMWLKQGRIADALDWAREQGLSDDDDLTFLREFDHITLARALIARYKSDHDEQTIQEALGLLQRLQKAAEEGGRTGSLIEILILQTLAEQALAHQASGDISRALAPLERALNLAEPQGYLRIFIDEGPLMAQLLSAAATRGTMPHYTRKLLAAFPTTEPGTARTQSDIRKQSGVNEAATSEIIEPLSQREREVLRLLDSELSGPEIARELLVSLNTMRTHTKNIYSKLGINNRRAAVRRAEELGLL